VTTKLPVHVEIALPVFRKLKRLLKKCPHSYDDLQGLIRQLERGQTPGDQISGVHYTVYKVRVRNTDMPKGKSGGYRVIYYMRTADNIVIIMMYSKSERKDVDADEIRRVIDDL
jgi:mRNA-degrading endonuclease RelE of RelBE toxin-antitoxin system